MQIAKQIRDKILSGELTIGDRLPAERAMAQDFGTSRASIREALSALEMLGIIECRSGQGNFICADGSSGSIDGELLKALLRGHEPLEIFESRLELEPSLASLASDRATQDEKAELKNKLEQLTLLPFRVQSGTETIEEIVDEYMELDRLFHLEIGKCGHNSVLFMVFSAVNYMMKETHWRELKRKNLLKDGNLDKYNEEHTTIFRAIWEGNAEQARSLMYQHIFDVQQEIL